jgi:hypothetical protein
VPSEPATQRLLGSRGSIATGRGRRLRRTPSNLEFMSRPGFHKDPGLFVCPFISGPVVGPALCVPPGHAEVRCTSDRSLTSCCETHVPVGARRVSHPSGYSSQANVALPLCLNPPWGRAGRSPALGALCWQSATTPWSRPRVQLPVSAPDISWRVCFGTTAERRLLKAKRWPGCAPRGRPRRAASQRFGGDPPSRRSTTAMR